jgi:hypothetical protein
VDEAVMAYFNIPFQNLPGETEGSYGKSHSTEPVSTRLIKCRVLPLN